MSKCKDCKYAQAKSSFKIKDKEIESICCALTRFIMDGNKTHNCSVFNLDLSPYDICYNCKYYGGGGDWGLFCSHEEMYHHLGSWSDDPCKYYEKKVSKHDG